MYEKKYYLGFENSRGQRKEGTRIKELKDLAENRTDFSEKDIVQRTAEIVFAFTQYLAYNGLTEK